MSGAVRYYEQGEISVRLRGLESGSVRLHIEHASGAALIVPFCEKEAEGVGYRIHTVGFDGTRFTIQVDESEDSLSIDASGPTAILGGQSRVRLPRSAADKVPATGPLRVTGDEPTMPIGVKK